MTAVRLSLLAFALTVLFVPAAALAQRGPTQGTTLRFLEGHHTGRGYEMARADVRYGFSVCDGNIWVTPQLVPSSVTTGHTYSLDGKAYPVTPVHGSDDAVWLAGQALLGGRLVGTFAESSSYTKGAMGGCGGLRLDRLDAHLEPRSPGERYPREYVEQFLARLTIVLEPVPALVSREAEAEIRNRLEQAERAEREAQAARERQEREAQRQREQAEREAQRQREQAEREAQAARERQAREAQEREMAAREQHAGAGLSGGERAPSSAATSREQQAADANARYEEYQRNFQAEQERKAQARAEAREREARERAEEQRRAAEALAAEQERIRREQAEREAQAQQIAEAAAPLVAEGLEAIGDLVKDINAGMPTFTEVSFGCRLSTNRFTAFTPGCTANFRTGALIYFTLGGGWSASPPLLSEVYGPTYRSSNYERLALAEASISTWFVELGAGLNFPFSDDFRLMFEVAPFLGAGTLAPVGGFSTSESELLLVGLSLSGTGWYLVPSTNLWVGLTFRHQGVGIGFMAEDDEDDLLASESHSENGWSSTRDLRLASGGDGWYSSLGLSVAIRF